MCPDVTPLAPSSLEERHSSTTPITALQEISTKRILLPEWLPRKHTNYEHVKSLTNSISLKGIQTPILVRPASGLHGEGLYELIAGLHRLTAAKQAKLSTVPAVVRTLTDEEALLHSLMENNLRQAPSVIDETESIMTLLCQSLTEPPEQVATLLHKVAKNPACLENNDILQRWDTVLGIFSALGKSWASYRANDMPMLNWPEDIQEAVRAQKIQPSKGRIIARVESPSQRQELLQEAIDASMTVEQIKRHKIEKLGGTVPELCGKDLKAKAESAWSKLEKSTVWDDAKRKEELAVLLRNLNRLLHKNLVDKDNQPTAEAAAAIVNHGQHEAA